MEKQGEIKPGLTPPLDDDQPGIKTASTQDPVQQLDQADIQKRMADATRSKLEKPQ